MKYFFKIFLLTLAACWLTGCDDGRIYLHEDVVENRHAGGTFLLNSIDAFPSSDAYSLVFASFGENDTYPLSYKSVTKPSSENAKTEITLGNVSEQATRITLSVIDKSKKLVHHFYIFEISGSSESITLPEETVDLAEYERLQNQLFSGKCIACHGGSNFTAAQLNLTADKSYDNLVGVNSTVNPASVRVVSGSLSQSFIYCMLNDRDLIGTDHTEMVEDDDIALLKKWILNGCPE